MEIRIDVAVGADDETRAFALHWLRIARVPPRRIFILGPLKKEIFEGGAFASLVLLGDFDNHNTRCDDLEYFGKSAVQLMDDVLAGLSVGRGNGGCGRGLWLGRGR